MRSILPLICLMISAPVRAQSADVREIALPESAAYPEGIAYDPSTGSLYAGSAVDGALQRIDLRSGRSVQIVNSGLIAPVGSRFPAMLGMKLDKTHHLWIAGGRTGLVTIVDPSNGAVLAQRKAPSTSETLLNDLIFVNGSAYITDTFVPILWKLSRNGSEVGQLEPWLDLRGTAISFADGPNLNGIVATKDGKSLIVDQMNNGALFRIDIATRAVTRIDVGTEDLTGSDGLTLEGHTLYVDRQWAGEVVAIRLNGEQTAGTVIKRFRSPEFRYPADSVRVGQTLLITNAQFNRHDDGTAPALPFSISEVPLAALK